MNPIQNNPRSNPNAKGVAALACGSLSLISFGAFPIPTILGIAAIVLGYQALKVPGANRYMAYGGSALGCLGIIVPLLFLGVLVALFALI